MYWEKSTWKKLYLSNRATMRGKFTSGISSKQQNRNTKEIDIHWVRMYAIMVYCLTCKNPKGIWMHEISCYVSGPGSKGMRLWRQSMPTVELGIWCSWEGTRLASEAQITTTFLLTLQEKYRKWMNSIRFNTPLKSTGTSCNSMETESRPWTSLTP